MKLQKIFRKKSENLCFGKKNKLKKEKNLVVLNYDILKDKYLKKINFENKKYRF